MPPLEVRLLDAYRHMAVRRQTAKNRPAEIWRAHRGLIYSDRSRRNQMLGAAGGSASRSRGPTMAAALRRRVERD